MPNNNPNGVGGFKKGQSGNPGGLKHRHIGDLSREARRYAGLAVSTLVKICRKGIERNQLVAARELLDRGYGRPAGPPDIARHWRGGLCSPSYFAASTGGPRWRRSSSTWSKSAPPPRPKGRGFRLGGSR